MNVKASFDDTGRMNMLLSTAYDFPPKLLSTVYTFDLFSFAIIMLCYGLDNQFLLSYHLPPVQNTMILCSLHFDIPFLSSISALFKNIIKMTWLHPKDE